MSKKAAQRAAKAEKEKGKAGARRAAFAEHVETARAAVRSLGVAGHVMVQLPAVRAVVLVTRWGYVGMHACTTRVHCTANLWRARYQCHSSLQSAGLWLEHRHEALTNIFLLGLIGGYGRG